MQQDGISRRVVRDASLLRLAGRVADRIVGSAVGGSTRYDRGSRAVSPLQPVSVPPTAAGAHQEHDYDEDPGELIGRQ
jgi:hypothetical protein